MKKFVALLLIFTITLSMSACGTSQTAETIAPETSQVEIPPTEYLPFEGETLTVLYASGPQAEAAALMVPEFEAVTGAKVEVISYPYEELHEAILLDLVSYLGTYDVININAKWNGGFAPYLEPLDDFIDQDQYDMSVWIENVLANSGQWQNSILGIPTSCTPHVFAYRTDLLPNGLPATWTEYRRAVSMVNKPQTGIYGIAVSKAPDQLENMFNYLLWSMGGNWADEDWNVTINSTETRTVFNHLNSVRSFSDPGCLEWTVEEALQAFLDGKAAVCETCLLPDLLLKADDPDQSQIVGNWALSRIPQDKTGLTSMTATNAVIPVGSQNKKLAWEWIKMYTSSEMQNQFFDTFTMLSPRKDFWEQKKVEHLAVVREALDYANSGWQIPAYQEMKDTISETLSSLLSYKIYQDTAIRRFDSELKANLENMPPEEGSKNHSH